MQMLLLPVFILAGFMGGGLLATQLMRWGLLLWVAMTKHGGDFLGAPRRRLLWAVPVVALLHPAPYLLVVVVIALYRESQGAMGGPFICVLVGLCGYLATAGLATLKGLRRRRQRLGRAQP